MSFPSARRGSAAEATPSHTSWDSGRCGWLVSSTAADVVEDFKHQCSSKFNCPLALAIKAEGWPWASTASSSPQCGAWRMGAPSVSCSEHPSLRELWGREGWEAWDSQTPWPFLQLPGFNMILEWVFLRAPFASRLQRITPPGKWSCASPEPHTPHARCWLPALQLEAAPVPQSELSSPLHHHLSLRDKRSDQRISNNHIEFNFSPSRTGSFPVQITAGSSATKDAIHLVLLGGVVSAYALLQKRCQHWSRHHPFHHHLF